MKIKVDPNRLTQMQSQLNRTASRLGNISGTVHSVRSGLDWHVSCESDIDRSLRSIAQRLDDVQAFSSKSVTFLSSAVTQYKLAETSGPSAPAPPAARPVGTPAVSTKVKTPREEREDRATAWKWGITIGCVVLSVAAIVVSGGAATPLVMGAIGAATGALSGMGNSMLDEYVEHGWEGEWDWGNIGKDAVVGGVVGGITSAAGAAIGDPIKEAFKTAPLIGNALESTNIWARIGSNAVVGGLSEVTSGLVTRPVGEAITQIADGETDIRVITKASAEKMLDPMEIVKDFATGSISSGISEHQKIKAEQAADMAALQQHFGQMEASKNIAPGMDDLEYTKYQNAASKAQAAMDNSKAVEIDNQFRTALDSYDQSSLGALDTSGVTVVESHTPEYVNYDWSKKNYTEPPYSYNYPVKTVTADTGTDFVRVYDGETSSRMGQWLMRASDIEGKTPVEIQKLYSLPNTPTHVVDVAVPEGMQMNMGKAAPVAKWGATGGGVQFDLKGQYLPGSAFTNDRPLQ